MTDHGFIFQPLTPERWQDLEALFGPRGACGGCWCMYWRLTHRAFELHKGEANRQNFKAIVDSGEVPGLLAYVSDRPAGWVAVAPREVYSTLARSRVLKPVDNQPVWSVVCFFVAKPYRRIGLTVKLLTAAVDYAGSQGACIVEGYPEEPYQGKTPDPFLYTGIASAFLKAGFQEVLRRSPHRPIMRYTIK